MSRCSGGSNRQPPLTFGVKAVAVPITMQRGSKIPVSPDVARLRVTQRIIAQRRVRHVIDAECVTDATSRRAGRQQRRDAVGVRHGRDHLVEVAHEHAVDRCVFDRAAQIVENRDQDPSEHGNPLGLRPRDHIEHLAIAPRMAHLPPWFPW